MVAEGHRPRILAAEPYYGGSHEAVLDGLVARIDAEWTLMTLPARKWKWRMRGSAITFAAELKRRHPRPEFDLVFASTFVNLAELYGMSGAALCGVPSILYFHENQLVYPNRHSAEWDYQFPLTNITSALTAQRCLFNSEWTRKTFLAEIPDFLRQFPDYQPVGVAEDIESRSAVLSPPFDPRPFDEALGPGGVSAAPRGTRVRIVWPHRWEHDKNPDEFFDAVGTLAREGLDFEVAVAGQVFDEVPESISRARDQLGDRLIHAGQPESREAYAALLATCDIAVSTAHNEFFGLAMVEAAYAGCCPLVPDRLAYSELYPHEMRYGTEQDLVEKLRSHILQPPAPGQGRQLSQRFTFDRLAPRFEEEFRTVAFG